MSGEGVDAGGQPLRRMPLPPGHEHIYKGVPMTDLPSSNPTIPSADTNLVSGSSEPLSGNKTWKAQVRK